MKVKISDEGTEIEGTPEEVSQMMASLKGMLPKKQKHEETVCCSPEQKVARNYRKIRKTGNSELEPVKMSGAARRWKKKIKWKKIIGATLSSKLDPYVSGSTPQKMFPEIAERFAVENGLKPTKRVLKRILSRVAWIHYNKQGNEKPI